MDNTQQQPATQCELLSNGAMVAKYVREIRINYCGQRRQQVQMLNSADAAGFIRKVLPDNSREHFVAVYLDGAHQMIGFAVVFTGTANACSIHPREVFQRAILLGAVALVVGHNHPSGQVMPSPEDEKLTTVLKDAGGLLGIKVLDHVIVTGSSHYSFTESRRM